MNCHSKGFALMLMCALISGCSSGKDSTDSGPGTTPGTPTGTTPTGATTACGGSLAVTVDWNDDGQDPSDTDGDYLNDTGCDGDTVDIDICDPIGVTTWNFGMAEDGAQGWTGEDCFNGYAGYDICHSISAVASLSEVCTPGEVVAGSTTLLDASKDPFLTYYIDDGTDCFVFGTDPAYYAGLGCDEMM